MNERGLKGIYLDAGVSTEQGVAVGFGGGCDELVGEGLGLGHLSFRGWAADGRGRATSRRQKNG